MAERFNCYIHTPATRATGREIRPDGDYVLASDYAKLEADHTAANATLDRLREVIEDRALDNNEVAEKMLSLLYPELEKY